MRERIDTDGVDAKYYTTSEDRENMNEIDLQRKIEEVALYRSELYAKRDEESSIGVRKFYTKRIERLNLEIILLEQESSKRIF